MCWMRGRVLWLRWRRFKFGRVLLLFFTFFSSPLFASIFCGGVFFFCIGMAFCC